MNYQAERPLTKTSIGVRFKKLLENSKPKAELVIDDNHLSDSALKRANMPNAFHGETFTHLQKETIMSLLNTDQIKAQWKQKVGDAKVAWGKLTEDELMQIEGQQDKLTGLIQERYAITKDEAHNQVKDFMDKHNF